MVFEASNLLSFDRNCIFWRVSIVG